MGKRTYPALSTRQVQPSDGIEWQQFADDPVWLVLQDGKILAICPAQLIAIVIAERLNEWFQQKGSA